MVFQYLFFLSLDEILTIFLLKIKITFNIHTYLFITYTYLFTLKFEAGIFVFKVQIFFNINVLACHVQGLGLILTIQNRYFCLVNKSGLRDKLILDQLKLIFHCQTIVCKIFLLNICLLFLYITHFFSHKFALLFKSNVIIILTWLEVDL